MINDINITSTPPVEIKQNLQANINSRQITKKFSVVEDMERLKNRRDERKKKLEEKNEAKIEASTEGGVTKVDVDYENLITQKKLSIDKRLTQNHTVSDNGKILVCVRKRPMSSKEILAGEIDTVTSLNPRLFIHECKIKIDGITKYIEDHEFYFDNVFSENEATEDLYCYSIEPTIDLIMSRGTVTCFAYGQTGSGKTFTMKGIQNLAIDSIFDKAEKLEKKSNRQFSFFISFYEIYGGRLYDLLNNKNKLSVLEDKNQRVQIFGLEERPVGNKDEMRDIIDLANSIRTTHNTVTNETSSRSHAICNILVREIDCDEVYGKLTLVDLAGSERAQETKCNEKSRRAEGAEINKSLLALKECIRALDARKNGNTETHVPFRASKLTLVLRDSFMPKYEKAKIIMLACIGPDLNSTNHTLNTLRYSDRLKEKTSMIKNNLTANKALVNTPFNSISDNLTTNPKNNLIDVTTNESINKNQKANNKDFHREKKPSNLKSKNMIYEEIVEDRVQKLDIELININSSKIDTTEKFKKELTSKNVKNSKLSDPFNSENNKNLNTKITQKITPINKAKKSPEKKINNYEASNDEGQYNSLEYIRSFTQEEENLIERHMRIIRDDAKFLTEEGDLLTNLKGIGPDNEIPMDEYVKTLECIINKKLSIYMDLKKKMEFCKKTGKRK